MAAIGMQPVLPIRNVDHCHRQHGRQSSQQQHDEWKDNLEACLQQHRLSTYTPYTIANPDELRAELAQVRRQGWALSEQQMELNYRGIAVPLLDRNNAVHGAISITMPINQEHRDDAVKRLLPVLQEAARGLRPLI